MDFLKFLLENKEKISKIASENGKYDSEGRFLLSKDDDMKLLETKFMEFIMNSDK